MISPIYIIDPRQRADPLWRDINRMVTKGVVQRYAIAEALDRFVAVTTFLSAGDEPRPVSDVTACTAGASSCSYRALR
jgi:hypothetical protein